MPPHLILILAKYDAADCVGGDCSGVRNVAGGVFTDIAQAMRHLGEIWIAYLRLQFTPSFNPSLDNNNTSTC